MQIGDLFFRVLADDTGLTTQLTKQGEKAGDAASASFGPRFAAGIKTAAPAIFAGLLVGAAANVAVLDAQVKRFQADVGATDEEAKSAASATTRLYGAHRAGFDQILGTLAKLRTDQGLNEKGAEALAGSYLDFANVAKTDGATAVKGFDDVLDAFNLTAEKGAGIMDALVLSNQKYGGSLSQRLTDLASLAPALQGLNLKVEDAVALENLFAASGLNAGDALGALKHAVAELKPGQTFDDLIRDVSSIEDPTLRAQKAIEIFGAKGGVQLAQALRPGVAGLGEFAVSATDAAGATEAASKKIDSSIPAQFELKLHQLQGLLIGVGGDALGVLASFATIATGLNALGVSFDILKVKAIAGWLATLGPVALAAGAGTAFLVLLNENIHAADEGQRKAAASAGDLAARQAELTAQAQSGAISWDQYDIAMDKVQNTQALQARVATEAAGANSAGTVAMNDAAAAAGRLAIAHDQAAGGTAAHAASAAAVIPAMDAEAEATYLLNGGLNDLYRQAAAAADSDKRVGDVAEATIDPLSAEAAALDNLAFRAAVAARNLDALSSSQSAANAADAARAARTGETNFSGPTVQPFEQTIPIIDPGVVAFNEAHAAEAARKAAEAKRQADEAARKAKQDHDEAVRLAKQKADEARREAERAAAADLAERERIAKVDMSAAFGKAKQAADAFFDSLHAKALKAIEDDRQLAYATAERTAAEAKYNLEKAKEALFAPVDAEQAAFDAKQAARQRTGLTLSVAEAAKALRDNIDPTRAKDLRLALIGAVQALQDFDAQAKITADRAAAQSAANALDAANIVDPVTGKTKIDADLDAAKATADATAAAAKTAEDKQYTIAKQGFDERFALLEKQLDATKSPAKRKAILDEIAALYDKYGINAQDQATANGKLIAIALADGMKSEVKAVEEGAKTLVDAINKYIRVHSPAEAGPWHDEPPSAMGARAFRGFADAIRAEAAAFRDVRLPAFVASAARVPSISYPDPVALASASAGRAAAAGGSGSQPIRVDLGDWFSRTFGAPRFLEYVEGGLVKMGRN